MHNSKFGIIAAACFWLAACGDASSESGTATAIVDAASAGGKLLKKYCSDCHAPPATTTHVADEWPNVIYRMQERRRMRGYAVMSGEEVETLVDYLQQYAKP